MAVGNEKPWQDWSADDVLQRLVEFANLDCADIIDGDGRVRPVHDWPLPWRRAVGAFDVTEMTAGEDMTTLVKKLKLPDRLKVLEMIGRHVQIQAFRDNSARELNVSGIDALHQLRLGGAHESRD